MLGSASPELLRPPSTTGSLTPRHAQTLTVNEHTSIAHHYKTWSRRYVEVLCMEFFRASAFRYASIRVEQDTRKQKRRLRFLIHELRRLSSSMFSSKEMSLSPTAKAKISALLNTETCFRFREACKDHILRRGMAAIEDVAFLHTRGEEFATQKPWEVFFLDNGRLNKMRSTIPASARQLVPAAGMSIVRTLNAEEDRVIKGISMVSAPFLRHSLCQLLNTYIKINSPEELKPAKTTARMLKKVSKIATS